MKRAALWLCVCLVPAAGCARSNEAVLRELAARSRSAPRPDLDRVLETARGAVALRRGAPGGGPVVLRMTSARLPVVAGRVNGTALPVLIDTGASHVSLSGPAARAAGVYLPERDAVAMVTPGNVARHYECVFESLALGPLEFGPGTATVAGRESYRRRPAGAAQGRYVIAGSSILSRFVVVFDFRVREVRLVPHGGPGWVGALFFTAKINGRKLLLLVDSGATRVILEPWSARELGLISPEEEARHAKREGAVGGGRFKRLRLDRVEVAGRTFRRVRAAVVNTFGGQPPGPGPRPAGLLGLAGFGELVWTVDYAHRSLSVEDPATARSEAPGPAVRPPP